MNSSEYDSLSAAIDNAIKTSRDEDRIVTLWLDDTTIDEAIDALAQRECGVSRDADHEIIDETYVDAWGDDWRVKLLTPPGRTY